MKEYQSLSHTRWDCKYHVVFIPKRRKKVIFGALRKHLGAIFRELARHKESEVVEGHLRPDHVHMCLSIPPKYAVANPDFDTSEAQFWPAPSNGAGLRALSRQNPRYMDCCFS